MYSGVFSAKAALLFITVLIFNSYHYTSIYTSLFGRGCRLALKGGIRKKLYPCYTSRSREFLQFYIYLRACSFFCHLYFFYPERREQARFLFNLCIKISESSSANPQGVLQPGVWLWLLYWLLRNGKGKGDLWLLTSEPRRLGLWMVFQSGSLVFQYKAAHLIFGRPHLNKFYPAS